MAGIGFILRKLARKNDISSLVDSYIRASIVMAGPWIITVFSIGIAMIFGKVLLLPNQALNYQSIIIYNFCFSLVFTAPFSITETRNLADKIYAKDVSGVPGMLYGTLALLYCIQMPIALLFYYGYAKLSSVDVALAVSNYLLICGTWLVSIYLSALFDYQSITKGFGLGMLAGTILTVYGALIQSDSFMLLGFNIGIGIILVFFITAILAEYPYEIKAPFSFIESFKKYKEVALSGLVFNAAIWVDKWIMWFSPDRLVLENGLIVNPGYDFSAFLAYFSTIPALALFLIDIETEFYEKYLKFYSHIKRGATFQQIVENQKAIQKSLLRGFKGIIFLQGTIALIAILAAPKIFTFFNVRFVTLEVFRYCVIGASYQVLILFLTIILWYFDSRKKALIVHSIFFILNALLTTVFLYWGPNFYGMGFAIATMVSFCIAAVFVIDQVNQLPFHTFITNNSSIAL